MSTTLDDFLRRATAVILLQDGKKVFICLSGLSTRTDGGIIKIIADEKGKHPNAEIVAVFFNSISAIKCFNAMPEEKWTAEIA